MLPISSAVRVTSPAVVRTSAALSICARTALFISLVAVATPTAIAAPVKPIDTATDTAPASAVIEELSEASSEIEVAVMPAGELSETRLSPSIDAFTSWPILLTTLTPAPLPASPTTDPPATATEPASTKASMVSVAVAEIDSAFPAVTLLFVIEANTPAFCFDPV